MSKVSCFVVQPRFRSVIEAVKETGMIFREGNDGVVLIWHDSIKDVDYFSMLQPWQIVNRIPCMNVLCRKASFARLIQKISEYFPELYSFVPKTYILPFKNSDFIRAMKRRKITWIVKPDGGSLGKGITIISPGSEYSPEQYLAVAQEYIESFALDNTKFDLRIYVLLASVDPLQIYVYRDGLARFCSEEKGQHSIFSQITNVTLNKENPDFENFEQISRLISDIFPILEKEYHVDIKKLWGSIDNAIILSILSSYKYLINGVRRECPSMMFPRCFQILGFDILLDNDLNPHVLEVNYRPSLDFHRGPERRMKVNMIKEAISIATPLGIIQSSFMARKYEWDGLGWKVFLEENPELKTHIESMRDIAVANSKYELIYPAASPLKKVYKKVLRTVMSLKVEFLPGSNPEPKDLNDDS
jgi:tubulin polyglutamylase TTLL6/13